MAGMSIDKSDILICRNSEKISLVDKHGRKLVITDKAMFSKSDNELVELFIVHNIRPKRG